METAPTPADVLPSPPEPIEPIPNAACELFAAVGEEADAGVSGV